LIGQFFRNIIKDHKKEVRAFLGLVLFPFFIDFTFRRLSHTSLLCLAILASVHFGFHPLFICLEQDYPDKLWMLPDVTYSGNIKVLNSEKEIFSKDDFSLLKSKPKNLHGVELIIGRENLEGIIPLLHLLDFGKEKDTLIVVNFEMDVPSFE
jgi:hypothetical protein